MLLDLGEQRHAVHLVHTQIADHQIDLFARQQAQRFLAAFGGGDVKTFAGQTHAQQLQQAGIVVNQTNWPVCVRSLRVGLLIGRVRRIGVFRFNRQRGAFSGSSCDSALWRPRRFTGGFALCEPALLSGISLAAACAKRAGARYRSGSPACARCPAAAIADAPGSGAANRSGCRCSPADADSVLSHRTA